MRLLLISFVALATFAGCKSKDIKKITVNGTASYKGQKLSGGMLKFIGPGSNYTAAVIQEDGTFTITDVVPGQVKVAFMPSPQGSGSSDGSKKGKAAQTVASLPAKFMDPETSGVSLDIQDGTTKVDVEFK